MKQRTNTRYRWIWLATLPLLLILGCRQNGSNEPADFKTGLLVLEKWNALLLKMERHTEGYRPPVSARMFAYVGMAAYEAALPAMDDHISMEKYCSGYDRPACPSAPFFLPASLNAAFPKIIARFFPTAPLDLKNEAIALEQSIRQTLSAAANAESWDNSVSYGNAVAEAVWNYSVSDSIGHDGFIFNYDKSFVPCQEPGCWKPDRERSMPALLPNWGKARPFLAAPAELVAQTPLPFSESSSSPFYAEAMEVFSISQSLSQEDRWIAEFWSDDHPGLTLTPVGRWFSITQQALAKAQPGFVCTLETYLRLGIALCDAGIICWDNKYRFQLERPETYIQRNIQANWKSLHHTPSFPSYPSGHAFFGAAAAAVLEAQLGTHFKMTDRTHDQRKEFSGRPRAFSSFSEMAAENAFSRVLLGVHFRMDCVEGLRIGKMIGQETADLALSKEKVAMMSNKDHHKKMGKAANR